MQDLRNLFNTNPNPVPNLSIDSGGKFVGGILEIAIYAAGFLAFFYMIWGAFQYIMASGKKEELQKARVKITYALIGLAVVLLAFFIMKFVSEIFKPATGGLPI